MRFGEIREILDYHTKCCRNCDEGSYEYCAHPDCNTFIAKIMREEIMALLDKEKVETDSLSCIPCELNFKGSCQILPEKAEDGDTYLIPEHKLENGIGWINENTWYWYDSKWNFLPNPPGHCKIHHI